jgi:hypothetical protein
MYIKHIFVHTNRNLGIITSTDAMSGFSNGGMLTVGVLFVVVRGVDKSQVAPKLARCVRVHLFALMESQMFPSLLGAHTYLRVSGWVRVHFVVVHTWRGQISCSIKLFLFSLNGK